MPASAALSGPSDGSPHVAALERCPPSGLETLIQQTSPVASDRLWVVASHLHHSITVSDGEHRGERAPSRLTGPRAPPSPPARRPTHQRALWVARAAAPSPRDPVSHAARHSGRVCFADLRARPAGGDGPTREV